MQTIEHLGQFKNGYLDLESCCPTPMPPVASAVDWAIHNCLVLCESRELHSGAGMLLVVSQGPRASYQDTSLAYSGLACGVGRA